MRKFNQIMLLALLATLSLMGCKDDEGPRGAYESGVIVINEGNFTDADASLSHISTDGEVTNNIFSKANGGAILGDVVQSVFVNGDEAYAIVNNSNKVEVINVHTADRIATIDASLPRYMTVVNGKGYITEWGSDYATPRVSVIDLNSHTTIEKIEVGSGAEQIVAVGDKLYIADKWSNTVTVINSNTNEVSSTITTNDWGISGLTVDGNGNVWGVHEGTTNWDVVPSAPNNDGVIIKINTSTDLVTLTVPLEQNVSSNIAINNAGNKIYYMSSNNVYAMNISDTSSIIATKIIDEDATVSFYGIGIDPVNDDIYVGDSKSFQGNGVVYQYTADGTKINTFDVGRAPNGFVFK